MLHPFIENGAQPKEMVKRMTNTLHRYGKAETLSNDYIVFVARQDNEPGQSGDALAAQKRFMQIAAE